jgi:hypothetical protein
MDPIQFEAIHPVSGEKIMLELRQDGWWFWFDGRWIGPFEFMTQAILAQIDLETINRRSYEN